MPGFIRLRFGTTAARCNPKGVKRIYLGLDPETANEEYRHEIRRGGLDPDLEESFSYPVKVELNAVINLTVKDHRVALGISSRDLRATWVDRYPPPRDSRKKPLTKLQVIGLAIAAGHGSAAAIILPSVRRTGGLNIVVFADRLRKGPDRIADQAGNEMP